MQAVPHSVRSRWQHPFSHSIVRIPIFKDAAPHLLQILCAAHNAPCTDGSDLPDKPLWLIVRPGHEQRERWESAWSSGPHSHKSSHGGHLPLRAEGSSLTALYTARRGKESLKKKREACPKKARTPKRVEWVVTVTRLASLLCLPREISKAQRSASHSCRESPPLFVPITAPLSPVLPSLLLLLPVLLKVDPSLWSN